MSDLTLKEVLIFDACEKDRELKKQAFIEWLTDMHNNDPDVDDYVEMFLGRILDKAKEML